MTAKGRLTSFWVDLDHVHVWKVLGSAIKIFVIGILDRPAHVNRCMNVDAFYPCSSLRADGQIEAEKTLPATSPRELELIIAPKECGCFVVDLTACTQKTSGHLFANVHQTLLMAYFESSN